MAEMNSKERVLCVLERGMPDRVPHFEWMVDGKVRKALQPDARDTLEFYELMGWDAVVADTIYHKEKVGDKRWRSEWGFVTQETPEEHGIEVESPIKTLKDLQDYTPPDPRKPERFTAIEEAITRYDDNKAVVVHLNDVFSLPRYLMGMQDLLMAVITEPELVKGLVKLSVDHNLALAEEVVARGVKIIYTGDDFAQKTRRSIRGNSLDR